MRKCLWHLNSGFRRRWTNRDRPCPHLWNDEKPAPFGAKQQLLGQWTWECSMGRQKVIKGRLLKRQAESIMLQIYVCGLVLGKRFPFLPEDKQETRKLSFDTGWWHGSDKALHILNLVTVVSNGSSPFQLLLKMFVLEITITLTATLKFSKS